MVLTEKGILQKHTSKEGQYDWQGPIWKQNFTFQDGVQQTLFKIQDEFTEVV